jgi:hypothetical protein
LPERAVEDRVARLIGEINENNRVFVRQRVRLAGEKQPPTHGHSKRDADEASQRKSADVSPFGPPRRLRQSSILASAKHLARVRPHPGRKKFGPKRERALTTPANTRPNLHAAAQSYRLSTSSP